MPALPKPLVALLTILLLTVLGVLLWRMLPAGFETDLSIVGTGEPALVLVHDHERVGSVELMESLAAVRDAHPEAMRYLVADTKVPRGQRFAEQYELGPGTLILFDRHGTPVARLRGQHSASEIETWLNDHLPPF